MKICQFWGRYWLSFIIASSQYFLIDLQWVWSDYGSEILNYIEYLGMNYPKCIGKFYRILIFTFILAADIMQNFKSLFTKF